MEKTFSLGRVDMSSYGYSPNAPTNAYITVEYKRKENGRMVFSASGDVTVGGRMIMGGQCLDELKNIVQGEKAGIVGEIHDLWSKYHLNDMHPECRHQAELGWPEMAREKVETKKYSLTSAAIRQKGALERRCLQDLREGKTVTLTKDEQALASLGYSIETEGELPESIAGFYEAKKTEKKARGWLPAEEFQSGLVGKPCPVCGYKYGHGWNYFPIPEEDEKRILRLFAA